MAKSSDRMLSWLGAALVACLPTLLPAGNVCTWTGRGNDGLWGTEANWEVPPVSGNDDVLVFSSASAALTTENDVDGLSVLRIEALGLGAKTFNGKAVTLTGNTSDAGNRYEIYCTGPAVFNMPFYCTGNPRFYADIVGRPYTVTFNGPFTFPDEAKSIYVGDANASTRDNAGVTMMEFNGGIIAPKSSLTVGLWRCEANFSGPLDVNSMDLSYCRNGVYLPKERDAFRFRGWSFYLEYSAVHFGGADICATYPARMGWRSSTYKSNYPSSFFLDGHSQTLLGLGTATHIANGDLDVGDAYESATPATLTVRADAGNSTYAIFNGAISLVWDPQDPSYVLDIIRRHSNTTGDLIVRGGTLRLSDTATFANATRVRVESGATFDLASTATKPLAGLKRLVLAANAVFSVADGASACCDDGELMIFVDASSALALPDGFAQRVKAFLVNGTPLPIGTYTGEGGASGTVIPQIEGAGAIEVVGDEAMTIWSGAYDDHWSISDNWVGDSPTIGRTAYVMKEGTYSIAFDAQDAGNLKIEKTEGLATIAVDTAASFPASDVDISTHGLLAVSETGDLSVTGHLTVRDCGELAVNGGYLTVNPPDDAETMPYLSLTNALASFTDATVTVYGNGGMFPSLAGLYLGGGTHSAIGGSTVLKMEDSCWGAIVFGTGNHVVSGTAQVLGNTGKTTRNAFTAEGPGEVCEITFQDTATLDLFKCVDVGREYAGALTKMTFKDTAIWYVSGSLNVGTHNGCGEVNLLGSAKVYGGGEEGVHLGFRSACRSWGEDAGAFPTGIVRVAGWGSFYARGTAGTSQPNGFVIGDGCCVQAKTGVTSRYAGLVEISEHGYAVADNGPFVLGAGWGFGRVSVSGGEIRTKYTNVPAIIGFAGAEGELVLTGGTASFYADLAVGGISAAAHPSLPAWGNAPTDRCCAKGLVDVSGTGKVTVTGKMFVGEKGDGELRLSGAATVTAASLELNNVYDSAAGVQRHSTLTFVVDENGQAGTLSVSGGVTVGAGSRLVVDFSNYASKRSLELMPATWGSLSGSFDETDVTVTGLADGRLAAVDVTSNGVQVRLASSAPLTVILR